jgi:DNA-directed RNA polymerase subunit K/omega
MVLHALMDVLEAAGDDEPALEIALRELATGLTDDDINGLGNMDP